MRPKIETYVVFGVQYTTYESDKTVHVSATHDDYSILEAISARLEQRGFDVSIKPCGGADYNLSGERVRR